MFGFIKFRYSKEKNVRLKEERGIGFDDIIRYIGDGNTIAIYPNPLSKYPNQFLASVNVENYVYQVAFVLEDEKTIFLKTLYPSRKATKKYLEEISEK